MTLPKLWLRSCLNGKYEDLSGKSSGLVVPRGMGESLLAALTMIDLSGPDIVAVDEVKALILESGNAWKNDKMRCRQGAVQV